MIKRHHPCRDLASWHTGVHGIGLGGVASKLSCLIHHDDWQAVYPGLHLRPLYFGTCREPYLSLPASFVFEWKLFHVSTWAPTSRQTSHLPISGEVYGSIVNAVVAAPVSSPWFALISRGRLQLHWLCGSERAAHAHDRVVRMATNICHGLPPRLKSVGAVVLPSIPHCGADAGPSERVHTLARESTLPAHSSTGLRFLTSPVSKA
ncbi:hypothetical protein P171DRAFT_93532 [Karstenula rhodostoma CBS 690.94]|uniref:Uncharacterized protein n=1 Tax=Karstenula rhodostoma CBS 690.94 TaxID=1392251 RepID=A0A9P4PE26_9PLEO|nr:hypothetical protein P171DRAFT_93532 [Karstenula rhodostoma CBS 690.94]